MIALLLEPAYQMDEKSGKMSMVRGTLAHVADLLGVPTSSVSLWHSRINDLDPFEYRLEKASDGKLYYIIVMKKVTTP